ncbi:MAG: DUF1800 domain-containing protein [Microscillaceae bacterium]|nr:DUF1800 domain-containing protein [Microscillaceae bacterium]
MPSLNETQKIHHLYGRAAWGLTWAQWQDFQKQSPEKALNDLLKPAKASLLPLKVVEGEPPSLVELRDMSKPERQEMLKNSRKQVVMLNLAWLKEISQSPHPLREKMAFFWHDHFACQPKNVYHAQSYLQTLRQHALGKFEDLLLAIAKEPAMLQFLNNQQNRKASPNENFARELMELFTLGRGHYTEQDIKESARAFTGWAFEGANYIFRSRVHDYGTKTFMGKSGNFGGEDIIRMILENRQTATYLTEKIYRFFVHERPNPARIQSLAQSFYASGYDIGQLLSSIFNAEWFYASENVGQLIKSPVEYLIGLQKNLFMQFVSPEGPIFIQKVLGQMLFNPPNVAGWPGGRAWIDSSTLLFRLRLPEVLYRLAEIEVEVKDESDVEKMDFQANRPQRIQAQFDQARIQQAWASRPENLYAPLADYLLNRPLPQYQSPVLERLRGLPPQ